MYLTASLDLRAEEDYIEELGREEISATQLIMSSTPRNE